MRPKEQSRWLQAALGVGKGSFSREGPTLSIFINNQILMHYCYKELEQEGR